MWVVRGLRACACVCVGSTERLKCFRDGARSYASRRSMSAICPTPPTTLLQSTLAFRQADLDHLAKREIDPARVRSLDGSRCAARSADGVGIDHTGKCIDLGEAYTEWPALDKSHGHTPIKFLPPQNIALATGRSGGGKHAVLTLAVNELQLASCRTGGDKPIFYMHDLPQVGFGSVIEYAMMFLGRGLAIGAPLRLGPESSRAWTSQWFCGPAAITHLLLQSEQLLRGRQRAWFRPSARASTPARSNQCRRARLQ